MQRSSLIVVLALCGCSDGDTECGRGEILDADGVCVDAPASCDSADATSIVDECAAQNRQCFDDGTGAVCGVCVNSYREEAGLCAAVVRCNQLACAGENRVCVPAGAHTDAFCGDCAEGAIEDGGVCAQPNCDAVGVPGSVRATCSALFRVCTEAVGEATCGSCFVDYVDADGDCEPVRTCLDFGCAEANRACTASSSHEHATCGGCKAGHQEVDSVCQPIPDANCLEDEEGSILVDCDGEERNCVIRSTGAQCGGCKDGFNENPDNGACELPVTCDTLNCASQSRSCVALPNGHCTDCLPNFVEDSVSGDCRAVRTCAETTCDTGQDCAEATDISDAFCRPDCGDAAIWGGSRCEPCPPCDATGEVRRWPWPSASGSCICETEAGYFYSLSADVGPFRCDADGDGWVRESARISLESNDPVLRINARCDLAVIDRARFVSENNGESTEKLLADPLPLYESDRNDDDTILAAIWDTRGFPSWGRRLGAAELNRLTKVCHDLRMDYNDNGAADVVEWGSMTLGPTMRPEQKPFNELAYFIELNRGWYEPPSGAAQYGTYVIAEKSRLTTPTIPMHHRVAMRYSPSDGNHWRQCEVRRDVEWQEQIPPIGMDFAEHHDITDWTGMNHHSQFKCLIADPDPDGSVATELSPLAMHDYGYRLSRCQASGDAVEQDANPTEPVISCTYTEVQELEPGDVIWGGIPYIDHGKWVNEEYVRGCFNECVEGITTCPNYETDPRSVNCLYDPGNFGEFVTCSVWEVCNGHDDNANGIVDEGDPEGSEPCDTGELGRCSFGTTHCIPDPTAVPPAPGANVQCFRNNGAIAELCNGLDDDCDGDIDELDPVSGLGPESGIYPCNTGQHGICATGRLHCENGGLSRCDRIYDPVDENHLARGCNRADDNCDGEVDEAPEHQCGEPWNTYYPDTDHDRQGDEFDLGTCMCPYEAATQWVSADKTDCCDDDPKTYLGAIGWYTVRNKCKSFDYDCSKIEEHHYKDTPDPKCGICFFCGCNSSANGWKQAPKPYCGDSAAYYTHCNWVCDQKTTERTQECH